MNLWIGVQLQLAETIRQAGKPKWVDSRKSTVIKEATLPNSLLCSLYTVAVSLSGVHAQSLTPLV
jgi:hypothetical protein